MANKKSDLLTFNPNIHVGGIDWLVHRFITGRICDHKAFPDTKPKSTDGVQWRRYGIPIGGIKNYEIKRGGQGVWGPSSGKVFEIQVKINKL